MAKKTDRQVSVRKVNKKVNALNGTFKSLIDTFASGDMERENVLSDIYDDVDSIVSLEMDNLTSFTGDDVSTFLVKLFNDYDNDNNIIHDIETIFKTDPEQVIGLKNEMYKNKMRMYDDLNMIASHLYEMQEAVDSTRDAIITSDDLTEQISRLMGFRNSPDKDKATYVDIVQKLEKKLKLPKKLKNHIIPKTLSFGEYYVYTIPYSKLLEEHYLTKAKSHAKATMESFSTVDFDDMKDDIRNPSNYGKIGSAANSILDNIEVYNDSCAIPIVEGVSVESIISKDQIDKIVKSSNKNKSQKFNDGTVDIHNIEKDMFKEIEGCYMKLIDPRKIIPIKILDEVIGYYYIHAQDLEVSKSAFTTQISINDTSKLKNVENGFISKMATKVVNSFDKKFLHDNEKFKDLIVDSLMYNEYYNKKIKYQFIPVDYMTRFSINENEEGEGVSILDNALFYAKLYLALLIFKVVSILSKSNDTKIFYVKESGLDKNTTNKIQSVARAMKQREVNFNDILNYNTMMSKVGSNKEIFVPMGVSGEKGIDFDVMAGQDIPLNTELMEMLRSGAISATGVPSVIMNYINEADYSRTLVMANAKFVGRIKNHQIDFDESITELYKKVIIYSNVAIPEDIIKDFFYTLSAPRALNNNNMQELITSTQQIIDFMTSTKLGESSTDEQTDAVKDIFRDKIARELLPMLPWAKADELIKSAQQEAVKLILERKNNESSAEV